MNDLLKPIHSTFHLESNNSMSIVGLLILCTWIIRPFCDNNNCFAVSKLCYKSSGKINKTIIRTHYHNIITDKTRRTPRTGFTKIYKYTMQIFHILWTWRVRWWRQRRPQRVDKLTWLNICFWKRTHIIRSTFIQHDILYNLAIVT